MTQLKIHLPESLHRYAKVYAAQEGISVNQLLTTALAEKLAALEIADDFAERARRGDQQAALALLDREGGQPPAEDDRLS